MKTTSLITFLVLLTFNFCFAQEETKQAESSGNFIEFGLGTSTFFQSSILDKQYQILLLDPNTDSLGFIASPTGRNYSAKFRYGHKVGNSTHLISQIGFAQINLQGECFCHFCDKQAVPETLLTIYAVDLGIGIRQKIFSFSKFDIPTLNFSIEVTGNYSKVISESNQQYFGVSILPMVQYELYGKFDLNIKMGYVQTFNKYQSKTRAAELALVYKLD